MGASMNAVYEILEILEGHRSDVRGHKIERCLIEGLDCHHGHVLKISPLIPSGFQSVRCRLSRDLIGGDVSIGVLHTWMSRVGIDIRATTMVATRDFTFRMILSSPR